MTYQRNIRLRPRLEAEQDVFDETGEGEVGDPEIRADDRDGDDDDDRRGDELPPAGPFDLPELGRRLSREPAEASAPLAPGAGLALGLAGGLDLLAALARALGRRRLLEAGTLPAGALRTGHDLARLPVQCVRAA